MPFYILTTYYGNIIHDEIQLVNIKYIWVFLVIIWDIFPLKGSFALVKKRLDMLTKLQTPTCEKLWTLHEYREYPYALKKNMKRQIQHYNKYDKHVEDAIRELGYPGRKTLAKCRKTPGMI